MEPLHPIFTLKYLKDLTGFLHDVILKWPLWDSAVSDVWVGQVEPSDELMWNDSDIILVLKVTA